MSYRYVKLDASGSALLVREFQTEPHEADVPADEVKVDDDAAWAEYQKQVNGTAFGVVGPKQ